MTKRSQKAIKTEFGPPVSPSGVRLEASELQRIPHIEAKAPARYAWAAGVAMSRFLQELKKGKIIARICRHCDRVLVPPRMFCERCYQPTVDWIFLPGTAVVETFSISYLDTNAARIQEPILVGTVAFDGAPPHCGIMHYFGDIKSEKLTIGLPVEPVWKPERERIGSILDIKYFRPRRTK
jgi:uncharacterized OB-fold protein